MIKGASNTLSQYNSVYSYWNPLRYGRDLTNVQKNLMLSNFWPNANSRDLSPNSVVYGQRHRYYSTFQPMFPTLTRLENSTPKLLSPQQQSNNYDRQLQYSSPVVTHVHFNSVKQDGDQNTSLPEKYIGSIVEIKNPLKTTVNESDLVQLSRNNSVILPPFLKRASPEIQKKFTDIITNPNEGFLQKQQKLDALVNELDEESQQLYKQYQHSKDQEEQAKRDRIHETVATMSQNAQIIFAKISAVLTNRELNDAERWRKLYKIYSATSEEVKKEFNKRFGELL
uniref:DUF148 domain-containing protein n=1 Tax=Syphacia muris TaxID=451379 RepID=A0A0N5AW56_9BILA